MLEDKESGCGLQARNKDVGVILRLNVGAQDVFNVGEAI